MAKKSKPRDEMVVRKSLLYRLHIRRICSKKEDQTTTTTRSTTNNSNHNSSKGKTTGARGNTLR